MPIATILQQHLVSKHIEYDLVPHPATMSSMDTAQACGILPDCLAKGVVLRTGEGYILAVLPASNQIQRADLRRQLGQDFTFASEQELGQLFSDCAPGAVPPVGVCYGLDVVVEDSIHEQPDVYFEGGDHTTVVHVSQAQFAQLIEHGPHCRFGTHA
jgi:Ala-tRNA(Pro) deacylase